MIEGVITDLSVLPRQLARISYSFFYHTKFFRTLLSEKTQMKDIHIGVLGLGNMGSALAHCFVANDRPVIVWNRTPAKTESFAGLAIVAKSAAAACEQAELVVMCVADYAAAHSVLESVEVRSALRGKTLVQLTSGTPADARGSEAWARKHGIGYLDAAILNYPAGVGDEDTSIFYSGEKSVFDKFQMELAVLGGMTQYLGDRVGAASALDCALLEFYYAASTGLLHAAALCKAEEIPLDQYFPAAKALVSLIQGTATTAQTMISAQTYAGDQATLEAHLAAIKNIKRASVDSGLANDIPDALVKTFSRAVAGGRGEEELPAVFEAQLRPE
jgi:3-hydroxyisobutyrate dehydrogenase-like beta-hydroxyacid dehydrogenase